MSRATKTGGREATDAVIPGRVAISVGRANMTEPRGFTWRLLGDLARLESGHTPRRSEPGYWDGDVPWIGIRDATANHGKVIADTVQHITQAGLDNSSARLLPTGTVCLSRTASVGYVVQTAVPMATSQDFVNWVCGPDLVPDYLRYILMLEQDSIRRFSYGTTHQTMYYPDAKALRVLLPILTEQQAIAEILGALDNKIVANANLASAAEHLAIQTARTATGLTIVQSLVALQKAQLHPTALGDTIVEHYSLPAFDIDEMPVRETASSIKSGKFVVRKPSVLVSKLNPRFPRIWHIDAIRDNVPALASTEFLVLQPTVCSTPVLWALLADPSFSRSLEAKVAGTSGSHQRVKPAEVLAEPVGDPTSLADSQIALIESSVQRASLARTESATLTAVRDALLPELMSGRLRVKDAQRNIEAVL